MANVLTSKLIRWCSLLPIGIGACIGSIHLTNVSKPIATLNALELEKVPEVKEDLIEPEAKPPEENQQQQQQQSQQQQQQQPDQQDVAAASTDSGDQDDQKNADTSQASDTNPQSTTTDVNSQDSAAVVGSAVATGADQPLEVCKKRINRYRKNEY